MRVPLGKTTPDRLAAVAYEVACPHLELWADREHAALRERRGNERSIAAGL